MGCCMLRCVLPSPCTPPPAPHPCPPHCLAGAIGYVPLCFILPCAMWLKTQQLSAARAAVSWAVIAISGCVAVLAAVGSVRSLAVSVSSYRFFT